MSIFAAHQTYLILLLLKRYQVSQLTRLSTGCLETPKLPRFWYAPRDTDSPVRHRTPRGRATAPGPPHMAAQGVIDEKTGPNARLGERGAWK